MQQNKKAPSKTPGARKQERAILTQNRRAARLCICCGDPAGEKKDGAPRSACAKCGARANARKLAKKPIPKQHASTDLFTSDAYGVMLISPLFHTEKKFEQPDQQRNTAAQERATSDETSQN